MTKSIHFNIFPQDSAKKFFLDGKRMKSINDFLLEISAKMLFPNYFGNNYNALLDCLQDLAWIESENVSVVILNADDFLSDETQEDIWDTFELFSDAANYWEDDEESRTLSFFIIDNENSSAHEASSQIRPPL